MVKLTTRALHSYCGVVVVTTFSFQCNDLGIFIRYDWKELYIFAVFKYDIYNCPWVFNVQCSARLCVGGVLPMVYMQVVHLLIYAELLKSDMQLWVYILLTLCHLGYFWDVQSWGAMICINGQFHIWWVQGFVCPRPDFMITFGEWWISHQICVHVSSSIIRVIVSC